MNPTDLTLTQLRDAIAGRRLSAVEATDACLGRIECHNTPLGALHEVYAQRARLRAAEVDAGRIAGPLAGVPVVIKDNLCTDYGRTTCSSRMLENFHAPYTATAVLKLEAAGAIVLGKAAMDEFAMGSSSEHSAFGAVKNPWDTTRVPGGSSGGSAVAVAARLCSGALGSDTGGSIRQPAALTGTVGLKPTYGRVSRWGLVAFASSLDQIGCFTRTAEDAGLLLAAIAGHDPLDSTSADVPVPDYTAQLKEPITGLRIGLAKEYLSDANDPAVSRMMDDAIALFTRHGARIVDVSLPHTEYGIPTYYIVCTAEASSNLARYDGVRYGHRSAEADDLIDLYSRSRAQGFGAEVKRRIMLGTYALSSGYYDAYYLRALKARRLIKQDFDQAFAQCDLILCPTTTGPAFKLGEKTDDPLTMYLNDVYTVNCNLAGIPGLSIPGGFTAAGDSAPALPLGFQLLGPAFEEGRLLRAARLFQSYTDFHTRIPPDQVATDGHR
ncbi:MAG: Asp-tRNA(Asn)/Glu-tRNA(Gln) amidotransferase subunit GatA [Phycisphaeraceae bacterium]